MLPKYIDWILFCILNIFYINRTDGLYTESVLTSEEKLKELLTANIRMKIEIAGSYLDGANMIVTLISDNSMGCPAVKVAQNLLISNSPCLKVIMAKPASVDGLEAVHRSDKSIRSNVLGVFPLTIRHGIRIENIALVQILETQPDPTATYFSNLKIEGRSKECSDFEAKSSKVYQFADIYINGPLLALRSRSFRLDRNPVT